MKNTPQILLALLGFLFYAGFRVATQQPPSAPPIVDMNKWVLTGHHHSNGQLKYGDELVPAEYDITDGRGTITVRWNDNTTTVLQIEAYAKEDGKVWLRYTAPDGTTYEKNWESLLQYGKQLTE